MIPVIFELLCIFQGFTSSASAQPQKTLAPNVATGFQQHTKLIGSTSPQLANFTDVGRASGNNFLQGVTLSLKQTQSQVEALKELLAAQQLRESQQYHQWLSPQEYATHYGMGTDDIAKVETWLISKGFSNFSVNTSHTALYFDGTVAQIEETFSTEIHQYGIGGQLLIANAMDLEVPSDMLPFVDGVTNIDQFRPNPQVSLIGVTSAHPELTSTYNRHFLSPADLKKIYDFDPLYSKNFAGQGQRIAVVGQSSIDLEDIEKFKSALGLVMRQPTLVLVPNTGASIKRTGDELESDIDLEYSSAIAPESNVFLVYTGSDNSHNVFDALAYAVDQDIAPIISISYGECETSISGNELKRLESILMQANSQGETVLVASGDLGATGCETADSQTQGLATHGLGVQYPASSQYVTSIGGTMFNDTDSMAYWATTNTLDNGSAQSYIPEQAWNESRASARVSLLGSGGGASSLFAKPIWQIASGVPSDGARDLPDISIDAGAYDDGYVLCSSDQTTKLQGSCSHGLFDSTNSYLTVAGGTSFGAPIAAGIVALISQSLGTSRLGNINFPLYSLIVAVPNVLHDIVTGDNQQPCTAGSKDCSNGETIGYIAAKGYDQVTGLGTPDVGRLAAALAISATKPTQKTVMTLHQIESVAYIDEAIHIVADISSPDKVLGGTIQFSLDGVTSGNTTVVQNGTEEYTFYPATIGTHDVSAIFRSNLTNISITANIIVRIEANPNTPQAIFFLSSLGSEQIKEYATASHIMISPIGFYSGEVTFIASTSDQYLLGFGCYSLQATKVQVSVPAYTTLFVAKSIDTCKILRSLQGASVRTFLKVPSDSSTVKLDSSASHLPPNINFFDGVTETGTIMLLGILGRKRKLCLVRLSLSLFIAILCTGCSIVLNPEQVISGRHVVIVTGVDTTHPTASTSISIPLTLK